MRTLITATALVLLAACHEIPQDAAKSFAGERETKLYTDAKFNGDKALFEETLAERAQTQNEYLRTDGAKK